MNTKQTEALKLAREALEYISSHYMSLPKIGCMALAAIEEALAEQETVLPGGGHVPAVPVAVYGYCPECGGVGVMRERRPNGDDKCTNGHKYPSSKALAEQPAQQPEPCQCPACKVTPHASDCAVHNEPAYQKGSCDCGAQQWNAGVPSLYPEPEPGVSIKVEYEQPEFFTHNVEQPYDWSDWVCPDPKGYLMKCCDCGLVHEAEFGVVRYKSETEREDCDMVDDPNLQAVFRMRRSEQWSPEDTAHRAGGLPMEQPASKPWVGLTDEEWQEIDASLNGKRDLARIFVRAIEAKLREKNA